VGTVAGAPATELPAVLAAGGSGVVAGCAFTIVGRGRHGVARSGIGGV
jgi:hypothetical protein